MVPAYLSGRPPFFLNAVEFGLVPLLVRIVHSGPFPSDRRDTGLFLVSPLFQPLLQLLHLFIAQDRLANVEFWLRHLFILSIVLLHSVRRVKMC